MSLPLVTVMPAACMFAAAQTRMAMEMMPPRPMDRTQSKRASAICSGSLKRSDAPEACKNRLYGTMVVPIRPTAVRMPLAPAWPRAGKREQTGHDRAPINGRGERGDQEHQAHEDDDAREDLLDQLVRTHHIAAKARTPSTMTMGIMGH